MENNISNNNFTIKTTNEQINSMLEYYQGYISYNTNPYSIARAKLANVTITFYRTNNVLFQGKDASNEYNFWAEKFGIDQVHTEQDEIKMKYANLSAVGSDEVGTGDYFGPIVVCATYVAKENIEKLRHLGVKDSKLLTDKQMIPLALEIAKIIPYSILTLSPEKFNTLKNNEDNLNYVKALLHNNTINSILKKIENCKCEAILVDAFTTDEKYFKYLEHAKNVNHNVTLIEQGENAHYAVAAASILARVAFLKELKILSKHYGIDFLKGAGREVDRLGVSFVKSYGYNELFKVAKVKYANTQRIKQYFIDHDIKMRLTVE